MVAEKSVCVAFAAGVLAVLAGTPFDSTNVWNAASGRAADAANFTPSTAPGALTLVQLQNGGTMSVDTDLTWGALWVGDSGAVGSSVVQSGGTLALTTPGPGAANDGTLWLGMDANQFGSYFLQAGLLHIQAGNPQIGRSGLGYLDVSGGEFRTPNGYPSVGRLSGSAGRVDVHGTGFMNTAMSAQTTVGEAGAGSLNVFGGGRVQAEMIVLGSSATAQGLLNVGAGGTVDVKALAGGSGAVRCVNGLGGTIRPLTSSGAATDYMAGVRLTSGAGGVVIDTNGKSVSLAPAIEPSRLVRKNLLHRWSFAGETAAECLADSVGGTTATVEGPQKDKVQFADGEVVLPGLGKKQCTVALGANLIPAGLDGVTIEFWATPVETRSWSRMFSIEGAHSMFYLSWAWDRNVAGGAYFVKAADIVLVNNAQYFAPLTLGIKTHYSLVFERTATGWNIIAYWQDALTGKLRRAYRTVSTATDWDASDIGSSSFNLGYSANDEDACCRFDEVRVWNVALTETELFETSVRGPDADFTSEPGLTKAGDGMLTVAAANTYDGPTDVRKGALALAPVESPIRRWSFENGSLRDSIIGKDAVQAGSGIVPSADGKAVEFPGADHSTTYLALGAEWIPAEGTEFTLEFWTTLREARTWSRLFTISGKASGESLFMTWVNGTDNTQDLAGYITGGSGKLIGNQIAPWIIGQPYHVAVVCRRLENGHWALNYYKQNADTGALEKRTGQETVEGWSPAKLTGGSFNLGWSTDGGNDDAHARYDEVRVWKRALTEAEITANGVLGPDRLPMFPTAVSSAGSLPSETALKVASGAEVILGGAAQTVASLSGAGTVRGPGALTATETIQPGGVNAVGELTLSDGARLVGSVALDVAADGSSDRLVFEANATYDVSGIRWTVADETQLAPGRKYLIAETAGATLTGAFDVSALPAGYNVKQKGDQLLLCPQQGVIILFR